jgi:hypothetical protein
MGALDRMQYHRDIVKVIKLAVMGQYIGTETAADQVQRFRMLLLTTSGVDAIKRNLDGGGALADSELEAAAAHVVKHADLFDQADRMIERQSIDERNQANTARALCDSGQQDVR